MMFAEEIFTSNGAWAIVVLLIVVLIVLKILDRL